MTCPKSPRKEGSQEDHKEERFFVIFVSLRFNAFTLLRAAGSGQRAASQSISLKPHVSVRIIAIGQTLLPPTFFRQYRLDLGKH